jgi:CheY-like chemotaxis protein
VKFTQEGRISLAITRTPDAVEFQVSDTGIGIAPRDLDRLFDDFFQADASLSRRHGGSGLGLAICRELTHLMGGTITAVSAPGEGSVFTLILPLQRVHTELDARVSEPFQDSEPAQLRILAAEDNETNRLVLKTLLAQADVVPTFAVNGKEALAAWEAQGWDLILMDIQMPEMDGLAAARAIRHREAATGRMRTPIIAVTANAMAHQLAEYAAAGIDDVVPKPVDITRLFATLEKVLDNSDDHQAAATAA